MSTSNLNIGLPTDNPVTNSTPTRAASQYTSLHQQCRSLRPRLLCIRNFPDFFTLSSSADSLQTTDTVTQLWDCFASGISLCYLFNLLPPPVVPIVIDTDPSRFNVSDARAKKRAIALFAMHIRQVVQCEPFTVSDIWDRNSTDGLVKASFSCIGANVSLTHTRLSMQ
jgi:cell division control protein 24